MIAVGAAAVVVVVAVVAAAAYAGSDRRTTDQDELVVGWSAVVASFALINAVVAAVAVPAFADVVVVASYSTGQLVGTQAEDRRVRSSSQELHILPYRHRSIHKYLHCQGPVVDVKVAAVDYVVVD